jgi:hypothetical protein
MELGAWLKYEALSSNPSTNKNKQQQKKNQMIHLIKFLKEYLAQIREFKNNCY